MSEIALTIKQENFCLHYIETGNASEAYRRSYDVSKMKETSVNRLAKELMDNIKIASRIAALRKPVVERAQVTLEQHLNDLKELRDAAWLNKKYGPAIQAEISRGKASGHYIERSEVGEPGAFDKLDDDELERSIEQALRAIDNARTKAPAVAASPRKAKALERK
jgi:phage terminase small subunit